MLYGYTDAMSATNDYGPYENPNGLTDFSNTNPYENPDGLNQNLPADNGLHTTPVVLTSEYLTILEPCTSTENPSILTSQFKNVTNAKDTDDLNQNRSADNNQYQTPVVLTSEYLTIPESCTTNENPSALTSQVSNTNNAKDTNDLNQNQPTDNNLYESLRVLTSEDLTIHESFTIKENASAHTSAHISQVKNINDTKDKDDLKTPDNNGYETPILTSEYLTIPGACATNENPSDVTSQLKNVNNAKATDDLSQNRSADNNTNQYETLVVLTSEYLTIPESCTNNESPSALTSQVSNADNATDTDNLKQNRPTNNNLYESLVVLTSEDLTIHKSCTTKENASAHTSAHTSQVKNINDAKDKDDLKTADNNGYETPIVLTSEYLTVPGACAANENPSDVTSQHDNISGVSEPYDSIIMEGVTIVSHHEEIKQ